VVAVRRVDQAVEVVAARSSASTEKTGVGPIWLTPRLPKVMRLLLELIGEAGPQEGG
jgi:hypothetical protein